MKRVRRKLTPEKGDESRLQMCEQAGHVQELSQSDTRGVSDVLRRPAPYLGARYIATVVGMPEGGAVCVSELCV